MKKGERKGWRREGRIGERGRRKRREGEMEGEKTELDGRRL